jgi:hypothetical protein
MNIDGLGWTASAIRQAQLLEWIIPQQTASNYVPVKPFYDALADQSADADEIAWADVQYLGQQGWLDLSALGIGGIEGWDVRVTPEGRSLADQRHAARDNRSLRRTAARIALLDWLHQKDAVREFNPPVREGMLESPAHGYWHGQPFTDNPLSDEDDLDHAAAWLFRNGFVKGMTVGEAEGPVRLYLTDAGVTCAERFGSDVDRYVQAQQKQGGGNFSMTVAGDNYGQMAGHHAQQEQHNTASASAEELRNLIASVAELVRMSAPQETGLDAEQAAALAAARDGAVDKSVLQRFGDWAIAVVRQGINAALVPAVSSTVTAMMLEAGKLTGHL